MDKQVSHTIEINYLGDSKKEPIGMFAVKGREYIIKYGEDGFVAANITINVANNATKEFKEDLQYLFKKIIDSL